MKTTIILTTLISIGTARTRRRASSFCRTVAMMANPFAIARSIVVCGVLLLVESTALGQVEYSVIDLGRLGGNDSDAYGINNNGQVVGVSDTNAGIPHAFRTAPNQPINPATDDLGSLGGSSIAYGINDSGQVVGSSYISGNGAFHAFQTAPNQPINPATDDLGTLGGTNSAALGINASGKVVGYSFIGGDSTTHPFVYSNGSMQDIYPIVGGNGNVAYAINNNGQVVGYAAPPTGGLQVTAVAFFTQPNQPINYSTDNLGTLGETTGLGSDAYGINSLGQVVGTSWLTGDATFHAFLYSDGSMQDLGTLPGATGSRALGINDNGQIVGISNIGANNTAFIYSGNGPMQELDKLIPAASQISLFEANGINDLGQIVGFGAVQGSGGEAMLLTPTATSWNVDANGNWSTNINWNHATPNTIYSQVTFGASISAPRTITLDMPATAATLTFDNSNKYLISGSQTLTLQADSGNAAINVNNGTHEIATPLALGSNTDITVNNSGLHFRRSVIRLSGQSH